MLSLLKAFFQFSLWDSAYSQGMLARRPTSSGLSILSMRFWGVIPQLEGAYGELSILSMRFWTTTCGARWRSRASSFNSLYEIHGKTTSTFSILLAFLSILSMRFHEATETVGVTEADAFNSLYEIHAGLHVLHVAFYRGFQFSLWDSWWSLWMWLSCWSLLSILSMRFCACGACSRPRPAPHFQFSLWDSIDNVRDYGSIEALALSILSMRFEDALRLCWRAIFCFQFSLWDSDPKGRWKPDTRGLTFNSLYEIPLLAMAIPLYILRNLSILSMRFGWDKRYDSYPSGDALSILSMRFRREEAHTVQPLRPPFQFSLWDSV